MSKSADYLNQRVLSQADSPIIKFGQPSSGALMSMGSIDNPMDGKRHVIIR